MPKQIPTSIADRGEVYSEVVLAGDLVFIAGQIGLPRGTPASAMTFDAEARATFDNVATALATVGLGLRDVVRCTVYLTDFDDFAAMGTVFASVFPVAPPARTTVGVSALARDCRIEVEATAVR